MDLCGKIEFHITHPEKIEEMNAKRRAIDFSWESHYKIVRVLV